MNNMRSTQQDNRLNDGEVQYMHRIGLSFDAIKVHDQLLQARQLTANQIAEQLKLYPSAVYRLCYELETAKFITVIHSRPKQFVAVHKAVGFKASLNVEQKLLTQLIGQTNDDIQDEVEIIIGRQALYDAYIRHAQMAKHDIRLYSIGIGYSKLLEQTQAAARKRGVLIKHVIQERKLSNEYIVARWLRLGVKLRQLSNDRGFHFYIIDKDLICITFSNPNDTEDRLSIATNNQAAIRLFNEQFQAVWRDAKEIL